jgi:HAD superfamily hydrolase (TIGR01509 family)
MRAARGILLDLDGTIADSIGFFFDLTCEVLREAGIPLPDRAAALEAISHGEPPTRFVPEDYPDRDAWLERTFRERWPVWSRRYENEVVPIPGACEAVTELARRGYSLAIVTSSAGELPFLERWGIRRHLGTVVSRDHVRFIKPHPEPMLRGASALGLAPAALLAVGDTPLDARAGRAAGIHTIGVLSGAGTEAELRAEGIETILTSLAALPDLLGAGPAPHPA